MTSTVRYERDTRRHLISLVGIMLECSDLAARWVIGILLQQQAKGCPLAPVSRLTVFAFVDCLS